MPARLRPDPAAVVHDVLSAGEVLQSVDGQVPAPSPGPPSRCRRRRSSARPCGRPRARRAPSCHAPGIIEPHRRGLLPKPHTRKPRLKLHTRMHWRGSIGAPCRIRTGDPLFTRQVLWPTELRRRVPADPEPLPRPYAGHCVKKERSTRVAHSWAHPPKRGCGPRAETKSAARKRREVTSSRRWPCSVRRGSPGSSGRSTACRR